MLPSVVVFVATILSIPIDRAAGGSLAWLPVSLAIAGTVLLLGGGAWMVAESRLSGDQIQEEIRDARATGGTHAMKYAPLDPKNAVILFADLQAGILERSATHDPARLRRAVAALAKLARLFEIPAIVTTAAGESGEPRVTPEIAASLGALPQHVRNTTDAFIHAATRDAIAQTGKKTLLVAGVATEIIVQHSALSGAARGYQVQVVVDACGGLSPRTEDAALRRLAQAGIVTTSIASIAGQLAGDFTQAKGGQAIGILYEMASP